MKINELFEYFDLYISNDVHFTGAPLFYTWSPNKVVRFDFWFNYSEYDSDWEASFSFSVEEEHEISLKEMCESIFGEAESSGEPYFDVELHYEEYYVDNRKKLKNWINLLADKNKMNEFLLMLENTIMHKNS